MTSQLQPAHKATSSPPPSVPMRGTQSFLRTIAYCWHRPSLLGLELLWRWGLGIPVLALLYWESVKILSNVSLAQTGIYKFSLIDSVAAAQTLAATIGVLLPPVRALAIWLVPTLIVAWALASGLGRSLVLRRYDPTLRSAPWLLVAMQLLRIVVLAGSFAFWFLCLHWAAQSSLSGPEPALVGYFVKAIFLSFAIFFFWALVSWIFTIAPLLALLEGTGFFSSLLASVRVSHGSMRGLRPKLVEINLILGVVKAALMMLAMVFCATPVPFKQEIHGISLVAWWAFVTVWYLAASDFFQVTRVIGFIEFWRAANRSPDGNRVIPSPESPLPA